MKRTYPTLCLTCGGKGFIPNPEQGYTSSTTIICPVCLGAKTVIVTEED